MSKHLFKHIFLILSLSLISSLGYAQYTVSITNNSCDTMVVGYVTKPGGVCAGPYNAGTSFVVPGGGTVAITPVVPSGADPVVRIRIAEQANPLNVLELFPFGCGVTVAPFPGPAACSALGASVAPAMGTNFGITIF